MRNELFSYLEWEFLTEQITVPEVETTDKLPNCEKEINFFRDDEYKIKGYIIGKENSSFFNGIQSGKPGTAIIPFELNGKDGNILYKLNNCYFSNYNISHKGKESSWKVDLKTTGVNRIFTNENKPECLIDWYINGPKDYIFYNSTLRDIPYTYKRERTNLIQDKNFSIQTKGFIYKNLDFDFLKINVEDKTFVISKVPDDHGPDWSVNIGFEYRNAWGGIPDKKTRIMNSELGSFIFGRQLLHVGYTIFDDKNYFIEDYACDPWGTDIRKLCAEPDIPPININQLSRGEKADVILNQLLPSYYNERDQLNIQKALWLYWIGSEMPLGTQLPIYSSAIESIMNGWFKTDNSPSKGKFMSEDEFREQLEEEMNLIETKIEVLKSSIDKSKCEGLLKRFNLAYEMGVMDKFREFFKEIKLEITNEDWKAIKARNKIAHGRLRSDDDSIEKMDKDMWTYISLIHKIILKLLGHSNNYIDRSEIGWEQKQL